MKVSDYIWDYLYKTSGSRHVFLLSGGGMMHLLDSVGKSKFSVVPMHHEQTASIAANAYGRTKNTILEDLYPFIDRKELKKIMISENI